MPDDATTQTDAATTAGDPPAGAAAATAAATDPKPDADALGDAGKRALDAERQRAEAAEKELKKLQRAQADREAADAKARGDWEKLATDRQAEIDRLSAEVARRDADALRAKVAARHTLPEALAARLVGDDEAALEADAKELAKLVKPPAAADTEVGAGSGKRTGPADKPADAKAGERTTHYSFMPAGAVPIPN